jgi:hypothetical protein
MAPIAATPDGSTTLPLIRPDNSGLGSCSTEVVLVACAPDRPLSALGLLGICPARAGEPQIRRPRISQTNLSGPRTLLWTVARQAPLHDSFFAEFTVITLLASTTLTSATHLVLWMPKRAGNGAFNLRWVGYAGQLVRRHVKTPELLAVVAIRPKMRHRWATAVCTRTNSWRGRNTRLATPPEFSTAPLYSAATER